MNLKLKPGYLIQEIAGEKILIAGQVDNVNYSRMLVLNDSAAQVVQTLIDREASVDDLVDLLTASYVIQAEQARKDINDLLVELNKQQVLEQVK